MTTRSPGAADFPPGWDVVGADLSRPDTLAPVLAGAEGVFLHAVPDGAQGFVEAAEWPTTMPPTSCDSGLRDRCADPTRTVGPAHRGVPSQSELEPVSQP